MIIRKRLILAILPLTLAVLACTCNNQDLFLIPTPTTIPVSYTHLTLPTILLV